MKIEVTQEDIRTGIQASCYKCPIALAIKRALPNALVQVDEYEAMINSRNYELPEEAADFIEHYDDGMPVKPFSFELPI